MNKPILSVLTAAFLCTGSAFAETVISQLPITINAPGKFVLGENLTYTSSSGNAIQINSSDVTLDLGGNTLFSASSSPTAIYVSGVDNVTIQNGIISGFGCAVFFDYYQNTANDANNIVQGLKILNPAVAGVWLFGGGITTLIQNNQLNGTGASGTAGIDVANGGVNAPAPGCVVTRNNISRFTTGILSHGGNYFFENTISDCATAIQTASTDKYRFNTTSNCTNEYPGGGTDVTSTNN